MSKLKSDVTRMRCHIALVLAAAAPTLGGHLNVFTGRTRGVPPPMVQLGRGGKLDITTGQATLDTLTPPPSLCTSKSNGWEFLMQDGFTFFSSFYTNVTQFFVAREQCPADAKKSHVAVLQSYGIMGLRGLAPNDKVKDYQLRRLSLLDPVLNCPDSEMNCTETDAIAHMMWDGTCNLILSVHGGNATHSVLTRHEVSEYDGQIRPEPPVVYERALPGYRASAPWLAGLSTGDDWGDDFDVWGAFRQVHKGTQPAANVSAQELNCPECVEHMLEDWEDAGVPVQRPVQRLVQRPGQRLLEDWEDAGAAARAAAVPGQRPGQRLVGRNSLAGNVITNVSASGVGLVSALAFLPPNYTEIQAGGRGVFFGLGVCCPSVGSSPDCDAGPSCDAHDSALTLLAYRVGDAAGLQTQLVLEGSHQQDLQARRLGVAIDRSTLYPTVDPARLTVWVNGRLRTFQIDQQGAEGSFQGLTPLFDVPEPDLEDGEAPMAWGYVRSFDAAVRRSARTP